MVERGKGDSYVAFYYGVTVQIYLNLCKFYNVGRGQGERININEWEQIKMLPAILPVSLLQDHCTERA